MSRRPQIVIVGSINMDLVVRCKQLPVPGETVIAESADEVPGGKGANQAVAVARAGGAAVMIGRIGDDQVARRLRAGLEAEEVQVEHLRTTRNCASGLAIVSVDDSGENSIVVVPGANGSLSSSDVLDAADTIGAADLLLLQLEVPLETTLSAIAIAREAGVTVLLDPAPVPQTIPHELLQVDLICPNRSEASALVGRAIETDAQARQAAGELRQLGAQASLITLGEAGAILSEGNSDQWIEPHTVDAVDTTAAGDAFAGALAVSLAEGNVLGEAARFASAAGAIAATRSGAQPSLPSRTEILEALRQKPVR